MPRVLCCWGRIGAACGKLPDHLFEIVLGVQQDGTAYKLVEVHFDDAGNFTAWSDADAVPTGDDVELLTVDLNRMIVDAICWEPVHVRDLKPRMKFQAKISMQARRTVADFLEVNTEAVRRQPKPHLN